MHTHYEEIVTSGVASYFVIITVIISLTHYIENYTSGPNVHYELL